MMDSIMHKRIINTLYFCLGIVLLCLILQIASLIINKPVFFPNIFEIIGTFFIKITDVNTYVYVGNTLLELIMVIVISFIVGALLGILGGVNKYIYQTLRPIMGMLKILPIIVLIVIIFVLTKINYAPIICAILAVIPHIYESVAQGIKGIDQTFIDVYKLNSNFNFMVARRVYLPLVSSHSKAAFISSLGLGIKILITSEYVCGKGNTIGQAVINAFNNLEYKDLYAYSFIVVILILILELVPDGIIYLVKKYKENRNRPIC